MDPSSDAPAHRMKQREAETFGISTIMTFTLETSTPTSMTVVVTSAAISPLNFADRLFLSGGGMWP